MQGVRACDGSELCGVWRGAEEREMKRLCKNDVRVNECSNLRGLCEVYSARHTRTWPKNSNIRELFAVGREIGASGAARARGGRASQKKALAGVGGTPWHHWEPITTIPNPLITRDALHKFSVGSRRTDIEAITASRSG